MADLATLRRSPLQDQGYAAPPAGATGLFEVPFLTQVNLRGTLADPAFAGGVRAAIGIEPPRVPNTLAVSGDLMVIWLGPDEWVIVAPPGRQEDIVAALREGLEGLHVAVTDLSANRTCIELRGPDARRVLQKGMTLDLHPRVFGPGQTAQTLIARVQVVLVQMDDDVDGSPVYRLFVRNSFARHLAGWLADAALEYR